MRFLHSAVLALFVIVSPAGAEWGYEPVAPLDVFDNVLFNGHPSTGQKPQSKTWKHDGVWWCVLPDMNGVGNPATPGTWLWRLDGGAWEKERMLAAFTDSEADVLPVGDVVHVLAVRSGPDDAHLISLEYTGGTYVQWAERPTITSIALGSSVETGVIDLDSNGRLWMAYDNAGTMRVRSSAPPFTEWSDRITLSTASAGDDICTLAAYNGRIGVLWSDQNNRSFQFSSRPDGSDPLDPGAWSAIEVIDHSAYSAEQGGVPDAGGGIADDHLNLIVLTDGTLLASIKTEYSTAGYPEVGVLKRSPGGTWSFHTVASFGTRPIIVYNDLTDEVTVFYTQFRGDLRYKTARADVLDFGDRDQFELLLDGRCHDVASTREPIGDGFPLLVTSFDSGDAADPAVDATTLFIREIPSSTDRLVACWPMEEGSGTTLTDETVFANNGAIEGDPVWVPGRIGLGLQFDGVDDRVVVADPLSSLDAPDGITVAAWIRPEIIANQRLVRKVNPARTSGYELWLTEPGNVSFRINGDDAVRTTSVGQHPTDGNTWVHVAGTFDGNAVRVYIDGVESNSRDVLADILPNDDILTIGAQATGSFNGFVGTMDEVRVFSFALTPELVAELVGTGTVGVDQPSVLRRLTLRVRGSDLHIAGLTGGPSHTIDIFDVAGRRVRHIGHSLVTGRRISVQSLAPGRYWLRTRSDSGLEQRAGFTWVR